MYFDIFNRLDEMSSNKGLLWLPRHRFYLPQWRQRPQGERCGMHSGQGGAIGQDRCLFLSSRQNRGRGGKPVRPQEMEDRMSKSLGSSHWRS